jgi:phosphoglycerate dehydrogenase-like enzyme
MTAPLIILDPHPRQAGAIFDAGQRARLDALGSVVECDSRADPQRFETLLPQAAIILGQPDLPAARLAVAKELRSLINVEGNFFPNVDYEACRAAGISVLVIAPAFAVPVAELALGLALDLARGISAADASMRAGTELYGSKGGIHARLVSRTRAGIIGFGAIGRAIRKLLRGFGCEIVVYDPWLPAGMIRDDDAEPVSLDELLSTADVTFVSAAVTSENAHLLGRSELERIKPDASLVLVSRADVIDFDVLLDLVDAGRFRAATDVFPVEPVVADSAVRTSRLLLSPHRGGGMRAALSTAAEMILDDVALILNGLPPMRLQPARRETILRMRSIPASYR